MDPLFNRYIKDTDLYLAEVIAREKKGLEVPTDSQIEGYDANIHFMDLESEITGRSDTAEAIAVKALNEKELAKYKEKRKFYEKYQYLYEWRVADGIEAAKEWEKMHGNHLVSMDKAVAYANGYMSPQEKAQLTEEQLYALEQWKQLSQVRDLMDDFVDTYGETGKFNKTNLKRVDAAMDRFVEYDPRIGTKLAYMVNAGARGLCEGAEDAIDYLKVSGIGMEAVNAVVK